MNNDKNNTKRLEITLSTDEFSMVMFDLLVERKAKCSAYKMKDPKVEDKTSRKEGHLDLYAIRKLEEKGEPGKLFAFVNYVNKLGYKVYIEKEIEEGNETEKEG